MGKAFVTYFDQNYLARGIAMIQSLCPRLDPDSVLVVISMDELTKTTIETLPFENLDVIPFEAVEEFCPALVACKPTRSQVEYLWTSTPVIVDYMLSSSENYSSVTYIDADLLFFGNPNAIYEELSSHSVLIHGHCFPERLKRYEKYGIYNVGLLCFKNNEAGKEVASWWRDRCIEWCYKYEENGKFGDQGYLNDWPERFPQVKVSQHPGIGVAPWNHEQYELSASGDSLLVSGKELIFYHFHSLQILRPGIIIPSNNPEYQLPMDFVAKCFLPYVVALQSAIEYCCHHIPQFQSGIFNPDMVIETNFAVLFQDSFATAIQGLQRPQALVSLGSGWSMLPSVQVPNSTSISPESLRISPST